MTPDTAHNLPPDPKPETLLTPRRQEALLVLNAMQAMPNRHIRSVGLLLCLLLPALSLAETTLPMQKFVLLFRQGPQVLTEGDQARRQAAIRDWARTQNAAGHKLEPRSLAPTSAQPGLALTTEAAGTWPLIAMVFLEARDFDEATRIAAAHPAKDFQTAVEVRPWSAPAVSLVTVKAAGPFDVQMTPAGEGRFALEKRFHGDLAAIATGEMLTALTATEGSAAYVAIEKVTGTLAGRTGSFHLQHTGSMNRGAPTLTITVVPDSGTDGLAGLTGTMRVHIASDGAHSYEFDYTLPDMASPGERG